MATSNPLLKVQYYERDTLLDLQPSKQTQLYLVPGTRTFVVNGFDRYNGYRCMIKAYTINGAFTAITSGNYKTCTGKYPVDIPQMFWGYNNNFVMYLDYWTSQYRLCYFNVNSGAGSGSCSAMTNYNNMLGPINDATNQFFFYDFDTPNSFTMRIRDIDNAAINI